MSGDNICRVCGKKYFFWGKTTTGRCFDCGWAAWTKAYNSIKAREGEAYEKWRDGMIAAANRGK